MKVRCVHCMSVRKVHKIDPATNRELKNEWWWFADCDVRGDEQEVGYDCGKGCCSFWERERMPDGAGNVAELRNVLGRILDYWGHLDITYPPERKLRDAALAALAAPARNCDMGTPEEQGARFFAFCKANRTPANECSPRCPFKETAAQQLYCITGWGQLAYEAAQEGGE